jgi:hypothetical protein
MIGFIIVTAILLAATSALLYVPNQMSAQITPSESALDSSANGLGFVAQNTTDPVQNSTAANVTQLATVVPTVEPIAPTSFVPVSGESDESTRSSNNDDDDDSNSDNNSDDDSGGGGGDDDSGDDDSDDDSGDGNGDSSVSVGGTFVSVS